MANNDNIDLDLALRLHFPILVIQSHDELRLEQLLKKAIQAKPSLGELKKWSASSGLKALLASNVPVKQHEKYRVQEEETKDPEQLLRYIKTEIKGAVILLPDFHPYLTNPIIVRLLKEIAQNHYVNDNMLVMLSHAIDVPAELERLCAHVELSLPNLENIRQMILEEVKVWSQKNKQRIQYNRDAVDKLAQNLLGLNYGDITRLIRNAIYDDGAITHSDVDNVMTAKYKLLSNEGALSFEFDLSKFEDIGGFNKLKHWLKVREPFFINANPEKQLDTPKGMLLVGVQGCGKSLAAKAVAGAWKTPLLRLDIGALYNKYIGETEKNIREALKHAEALAPCVLWIDEIEKAIQGGNDDSGTSNRILGTLLTWMAEKTARVFIVATSNDIEKLPPELMRKGRLDEIFFVDLPSVDARKTIIELHLAKRDHQASDFDLDQLSEFSQGFSGAEIEQGILSASYSANAENQSLATHHLVQEFIDTRPLSVVRAEDIAQLRAWAQDRTVFVD